ncbi:MAG TPA: hypothetical protein VHE81_12615, partial [Lacipirellulaceae bacterium]|nr:hypothetical protein [Lacipirellulaceae bacterium]
MRRKLVIGLVLLLLLIALLPTIVSKTPLGNVLLSMAVPKDSLQINVGETSLSWISGSSLINVDVKDAAGDTLLAAESIRIDHSLASLAMNPHDLGTIQIVRPIVHLKTRPDGSNLEDALRKLLGSSTARKNQPTIRSDKKRIAFAVQLVHATIVMDDVVTRRQWRVENIDAQYDDRGGGPGVVSLTGQIAVADHGASAVPAGQFAASLKPGDAGHEQLTLQADRIALAAVEPWLRRFDGGAELSGTLSGQATAAWTASQASFPSDLTTSGSFSIDQFNGTGAVLHGDRVTLARVELPWHLVSQPTGLVLESLQLGTDVGQVAIHGRLDPSAIVPPNGKPRSALTFVSGRHDLDIRGTVDVAKLVAMLPHTLSIRDSVAINSGAIDIVGSLKPTDKGESLTGSLNVPRLVGTSHGKSLVWDQPVNASVALRSTNGGIALDSLQCNSKFLHIEATGTLQQITAKANFDLNALAQQLGEFVDLTGVRLEGSGSARIALQQQGSDTYSGSLNGSISQLDVGVGPWQIHGTSELATNVRLAGQELEASNTKLVVTDLQAHSPEWSINEPRVEFTGDARWDGAKHEFTTKTAQLVSSTVAVATKDVRYGGDAQHRKELTGAAAFRADLARLAAWRIPAARPVQYLPSGQFTGNVRFVQQAGHITGEISATGQSLALTSFGSNSSTGRGGRAPGRQIIWQEPQLTLRGATTYDVAADRLAFDQFQIQSNTLQANATGQVQKLSTVAECNVNGTLNYDLAQVTPLLRPYIGAGVQLIGREQAQFAVAGKLSDGTMPQAQLASLARDPYGAAGVAAASSTSPWSRRVHAQ